MTFLSIASLILPGYEHLSSVTRAVFESSSSGMQLSQLIQRTLTTKSSPSFWNRMTKSHKKVAPLLKEHKEALIQKIRDSEEYKDLIVALTQKMLQKEVADYNFLSAASQKLVAQSLFAQDFRTRLLHLDAMRDEEQRNLNELGIIDKFLAVDISCSDMLEELEEQRKVLIRAWQEQFMERADMQHFKMEMLDNKKLIKEQEFERHAQQLSQFFPLLTHKKSLEAESSIQRVRNKYSLANADIRQIDEEELTDLLFHCMQQITQVDIDFMPLELFNKAQAQKMAMNILDAFKSNSGVHFEQWFKEYENNLHQYFLKQLQLINDKAWPNKANEVTAGIYNSLSYLWTNPLVNKSNEFVRKLADAHGFIQATGFSTQNENSFLAILDIYNYARFHEQISETQGILVSLLSPFTQLFQEYKNIGLYEKNIFKKLFRTLMPVVITVSFIILVATILVPLLLPELAFFAAFIPSSLMGLALSTAYVATKEAIYHSLRERYYGGAFAIPEYQLNSRMLNAFANEQIAQEIRTFYIDALQRCDAQEKNFKLKHEQGVLSQDEIDARKDNTKRRLQLGLEWYDIHSNKDLSVQHAVLIVQNRLQECCEQMYQQLQHFVKKELSVITQSITEVSSDVKITILSHNTPLNENENALIKAPARYALFTQPKSFSHKLRIEELDRLKEQISLCSR